MAEMQPKIQFKTNIPVTLHFPFGDFKEINNEYGTSYKYNVDIEGERHTLFATENLQERLQAIGNLKGASITVTKVELDGGKKGWEVVGLGAPRGEDAPSSPQDAPQQPSDPAATSTPSQDEQAIHDAAWRAFMWSAKCHRDAGFTVDLTKPLWAESVRAWAASILIASLDSRAVVRPHTEADPLEDPAPEKGKPDLPF